MKNKTIKTTCTKPRTVWRKRIRIFDHLENVLQGDDCEYCAPVYFNKLREELPNLTFQEIAEAIRDGSGNDYSVAFSWDPEARDWRISY